MTDPETPRETTAEVVLRVEDLTVRHGRGDGEVRAVDGVSLTLRRGETLALVGASGCGKTSIVRALLRLLPNGSRIDSGRVLLHGRDLLSLPEEDLRRHRWHDVAIVFQQAMSAWNPVRTLEQQFAETLAVHAPTLTRRQVAARIVELFELVDLPPDVARRHPHECSGGMRQRAMIALALSCDPDVLVADEPTTGLDVVVQRRILDQLRRIQVERGLCVLHVSHDLAAVAGVSDRIAVMHGGRIVEQGPTSTVVGNPTDEHTRALVGATLPVRGPRRDTGASVKGQRADSAPTRSDGPPILQIEGLHRRFPAARTVTGRVAAHVHAVDGVDLTIAAGECLGLVGESGSGKTTLARLVTRLLEPSSGRVLLGPRPGEDSDAVDLTRLGRSSMRHVRRRVQMILQDPYTSLDPRLTVRRLVGEPLRVQRIGTAADRDGQIREALERVGLEGDDAMMARHPHQLSGGQRQRVAIARSIVVEPELLVADEPTSMLDATARAAIVDLLAGLRAQLGLSMLAITHDLAVARHLCDRIAVMYQGCIVEVADTETLLDRPRHPYTQALLAAVPDLDTRGERPDVPIRGLAGRPVDPPATCRFLDRCPRADDVCASQDHPALASLAADHVVACHHATR